MGKTRTVLPVRGTRKNGHPCCGGDRCGRSCVDAAIGVGCQVDAHCGVRRRSLLHARVRVVREKNYTLGPVRYHLVESLFLAADGWEHDGSVLGAPANTPRVPRGDAPREANVGRAEPVYDWVCDGVGG